jgi:hypothetical protein
LKIELGWDSPVLFLVRDFEIYSLLSHKILRDLYLLNLNIFVPV